MHIISLGDEIMTSLERCNQIRIEYRPDQSAEVLSWESLCRAILEVQERMDTPEDRTA